MKFIKKIVIVSASLLLIYSCIEAKPKSLFKKESFNGYAFSLKTGVTEPDSLFKIGEESILMDGDEKGYLMSDNVYNNFKLTAQYRWVVEADQKKKRNSGIMYHVPENQVDTLWPKGIQYQIKTVSTGDIILLQDVTLTVNDSIYGPGRSVKVKHLVDNENVNGAWNYIEIIAEGNSVKQYLNGKLVNEGVNASENMGRILFQYEGSPIEFKEIKITGVK